MYITDEQAAQRLETSGQIRQRLLNRKERVSRIPDDQREIMGVLAGIDTQANVAEAFGTSQTIVNNSERGMIGTHLDKELKEKVINGQVGKQKEVADKVLDNLSRALVAVGNGVDNLRADKAATIAVQMHSIMASAATPNNPGGNRIAIIIQAPAMKDRHDYQSIEVIPEAK